MRIRREKCASVFFVADASELDTSFAKGTALLVGNPVQTQGKRAGTVTAEVSFDEPCGNVSVFDANGEEIPSQTIKKGAKSRH